MADEIFLGIYGAIIGAFAAFVLTKYSLHRKENKEIEKIHDILNDDFYRNFQYAKDAREYVTKLLDNTKEYEEYYLSLWHEISRGRSPIIFAIPNFRFVLWDAIVSSGSLIKLESHEIQLINAKHDDMVHQFEWLGKIIEKFHDNYQRNEENLKMPSIEEVKEIGIGFLTDLYVQLINIEKIFEELHQRISWIKKEFSNIHTTEFNQDFYDIGQPMLIPIPSGALRGEPSNENEGKKARKSPI